MPEQPPQEDIFGNSGQEVPVSQSQFKTHTSNLNDLSWKGDRKSNSYSGTGAPTSTPNKIGDVYVNTTTGGIYIAGGTAGAYSWGYVGSGSLTAFNKDTIAGLYSWYKADDGPAPTTEGTNITSWLDKSATGNTLTTVVGTRAYTTNVQNGLPGIRFVADSYIHGANLADHAQPFTTFVVFKGTDWGAGTYQGICNMGSSGNYFGIYKNNGNTNSVISCPTLVQGGAVSNNTTSIVTATFSGATSTVEVNNAGPSTVNPGADITQNRPLIGAGHGGTYGFTGYVFEWLTYDGALTTANLDIVKAYLNNKWHIY